MTASTRTTRPTLAGAPEAERTRRRLAKHAKYNSSRKGQLRNLRYEARNPHRKLRWSPITGRDVAEAMPEVWPAAPMPE